jgi:4-hydroxybenzoate polyprenyltransferase
MPDRRLSGYLCGTLGRIPECGETHLRDYCPTTIISARKGIEDHEGVERNTVMKHSPGAIQEAKHPSEGSWGRIAWGIFVTMRPPEWLKNTLVFAAVLFSGNLFFRPAIFHSLMAFVAFCLASSATYVFNDFRDRQTDLAHPSKSRRPIATGLVPSGVAMVAIFAFVTGAIVIGFNVNRQTGRVVLAYLVLTSLYSLGLKHIVILDVFVLATGFVLRVIAGADAIGVEFSSWLVLCTFLLALFLGFGKRRDELLLLEENARGHRRVLHDYSPHFLDMMMIVVTSATVVCYALYTLDAATIARFGTDRLVYTSVFVLYGIFRCLYLMYERSAGGNPATLVYRDVSLQVDILLWIVSIFFLRYYATLF